MKTKQINGKTAGNSLENGRKLSAVENVFHAVKTAAILMIGGWFL